MKPMCEGIRQDGEPCSYGAFATFIVRDDYGIVGPRRMRLCQRHAKKKRDEMFTLTKVASANGVEVPLAEQREWKP